MLSIVEGQAMFESVEIKKSTGYSHTVFSRRAL